MKITPATSNARRIARSLAEVIEVFLGQVQLVEWSASSLQTLARIHLLTIPKGREQLLFEPHAHLIDMSGQLCRAANSEFVHWMEARQC